jgi:mRNA interferase RelE/StbE
MSLAYQIEVSEKAKGQLSKLGKVEARRITAFLRRRLAALDDPRSTGHSLTGQLSGLWRYRVGDYRIVCDIQDNRLVVLVVELGHRGEIYR